MKNKIIYIIIFILFVFSINNIVQLEAKKNKYKKVEAEYSNLKSTFEETKTKDKQLSIGDNEERYFREQYNISKEDEILFEFPEDDENYSS